MAVWAGLGVNYKSSSANLDRDIAYFKANNVWNIRIHIPPHDNTTSRARWRAVAKTFTDQGFYVIYGVSNPTVTASGWQTYISNVLDEAALCQSTGACSEFQIGNELEMHNDDSITDAQLRANLRELARLAKAVFTRGPVSYATESGSKANGTNGSDYWAEEGKGDLDLIGLNAYGWLLCSTGKYRGINPHGYRNYIPNMVNAFGNGMYISEFNLDAVESNIYLTPDEYQVAHMREYYRYIRSRNVPKAYLYQWCGFEYQNDDFAVQLVSGDKLNMWDVLNTGNKRRLNIT